MALLLQVDGNFSHGLHRVGMEQDALVMRHDSHLFHREEDPGFVVGPHDAHHRRVGRQASGVLLQVQAPVTVHGSSVTR